MINIVVVRVSKKGYIVINIINIISFINIIITVIIIHPFYYILISHYFIIMTLRLEPYKK